MRSACWGRPHIPRRSPCRRAAPRAGLVRILVRSFSRPLVGRRAAHLSALRLGSLLACASCWLPRLSLPPGGPVLSPARLPAHPLRGLCAAHGPRRRLPYCPSSAFLLCASGRARSALGGGILARRQRGGPPTTGSRAVYGIPCSGGRGGAPSRGFGRGAVFAPRVCAARVPLTNPRPLPVLSVSPSPAPSLRLGMSRRGNGQTGRGKSEPFGIRHQFRTFYACAVSARWFHASRAASAVARDSISRQEPHRM